MVSWPNFADIFTIKMFYIIHQKQNKRHTDEVNSEVSSENKL